MKKKINKKKIVIVVLWIFLIIGLGIYILLNPLKEEKKDKKPEKVEKKEPVVENYKLSWIGAGDALIHDGVFIDARTGTLDSNGYQAYDFTKMFQDIKEVIEPYDLRFYNQETVIGGKNLSPSGYPNFNSPDEIGLNLTRDIGFNMVNLASNHTMDKGSVGAEYSAKFWKEQKDVYTMGSYVSQEDRDNPVIKTVNGISYAVLSYTYGTNGMPVPAGKEYLVNVWPTDLDLNNVANDYKYQQYKEQVKKDVEAIRDKVDVLMVSMHWGVEYVHTPTEYQKDAAKYLADLGVDVIIGTHPHVVQPIEFIDDTLVIYSLGNMISAQVGTQKLVGLMAAFEIDKEVVDGKTTKIEINNVQADLIWTYYRGFQNFKVIPFNKLTNTTLYGYNQIYEQYLGYVNPSNDPRIKLKFFN